LFFEVSTTDDQARLIAERVARRLSGQSLSPGDRIEMNSVAAQPQQTATPRARVINFVSPAPPPRTIPTISSPPAAAANAAPKVEYQMTPPTQSPWLAPFSANRYAGNPPSANQNQPVSHPSQERFGVEEATVSELVEFFENEKQCSVDPSGKPCDHCAMCSSRGF